jgi:flagellar biogenesis protein FliO
VAWLENPDNYIRIFLGLVGAVSLFFLLASLLKRLPQSLTMGQGQLFSVLMKQPLGNQRSLCLIRCVGKVYLLYEGTEGLQVIDRFDGEEIEDYLKQKQTKNDKNIQN